jgi:hypothetical protein
MVTSRLRCAVLNYCRKDNTIFSQLIMGHYGSFCKPGARGSIHSEKANYKNTNSITQLLGYKK